MTVNTLNRTPGADPIRDWAYDSHGEIILKFATTGVCPSELADLLDTDVECQAAVEDAFAERLQRVAHAVSVLQSGSV